MSSKPRPAAPERVAATRLSSLKLLLTIATFSALILEAGCHSTPKLIEYQPSYVPDERKEAMDVPIIVVGRLLHESQIDKKARVSKWGQDFYVALWRVTVHVENVLRGTIQPGDIEIYYFRYNFVSGPARVLEPGRWEIGNCYSYAAMLASCGPSATLGAVASFPFSLEAIPAFSKNLANR